MNYQMPYITLTLSSSGFYHTLGYTSIAHFDQATTIFILKYMYFKTHNDQTVGSGNIYSLLKNPSFLFKKKKVYLTSVM